MEHNIFGKGDVLLLQLFCYVCSLLKIKLQFLISSNLKLFSLYFIAMSPLFMHIRLLFILLWHFKSYLNKMNRTITTIRKWKKYIFQVYLIFETSGNEKNIHSKSNLDVGKTNKCIFKLSVRFSNRMFSLVLCSCNSFDKADVFVISFWRDFQTKKNVMTNNILSN